MTESNGYLKQVVRTGAVDLWYWVGVREFAKWWFGLIQMLLVVAVVKYFATIADNPWLNAIAHISQAALNLYMLSYINTHWLDPMHNETRRWLRTSVALLVMLPVIMGVNFFVYEVLPGLIKQLGELQGLHS